MAGHFYGIERGGGPADVVNDTSTQSVTVEIQIELSDGASKTEVVDMIDTIKREIATGTWPPA